MQSLNQELGDIVDEEDEIVVMFSQIYSKRPDNYRRKDLKEQYRQADGIFKQIEQTELQMAALTKRLKALAH